MPHAEALNRLFTSSLTCLLFVTDLNGRAYEGWRNVCKTSLWTELCSLQNVYAEALTPKSNYLEIGHIRR